MTLEASVLGKKMPCEAYDKLQLNNHNIDLPGICARLCCLKQRTMYLSKESGILLNARGNVISEHGRSRDHAARADHHKLCTVRKKQVIGKHNNNIS